MSAPTETRVDAARLRKQLEWAEAHPEEWNQRTYIYRTACGTTCCIAGHTVLDEGLELDWDAIVLRDGRQIHDVAAEILGLNPVQSVRLFSANNTLADLWRLASQFTNGEIEIPVQHQPA